MTNKVRDIAPVIWDEIKKANNILLHCHRDPDGDSVGSALGMMHVLKNLGKNATVIAGDSEKPQFLRLLPGFEQIKSVDYMQIKAHEFDLFIILDSSDVSRVTRKAEVVFPQSMSVVNIDHHASNQNFGQINLVDSSYPATSQIIYDLLKTGGVEVTADAALCLYIGMFTDTGGFKYPPVSWETLAAASELAKLNPNFPEVIFEIENSNDASWIKFLGLALSSVKLYFSGQVAISAISHEQIVANGISLTSISKSEIANMLKSVSGWDIGVSLVEEEEGMSALSIRTRLSSKFEASKLAVNLGGGGHQRAGGALIKKPFDQAVQTLLETIATTFPELGKP